MPKTPSRALQNTTRNKLAWKGGIPDTLGPWIELYFQREVKSSDSSRKVSRRDINRFHNFMLSELGNDFLINWSPRLTKNFLSCLRDPERSPAGLRLADRTINRIISHLKPLANWIDKMNQVKGLEAFDPFPTGNPMRSIPQVKAATLLCVERALSPTERRRMLDAADLLPVTGGRSKDRNRYRGNERRPQRKNYRPYRNRAIIYTLIETGMRRLAATRIALDGVDPKRQVVKTIEKGDNTHEAMISRQAVQAIRDYVERERHLDAEYFESLPDAVHPLPLFLPARNMRNQKGHLLGDSINRIWDEVAEVAKIEGRTPHSARHAMGRHIIDKTGNPSAVQRQLGHGSPWYANHYSRITNNELANVLDERE